LAAFSVPEGSVRCVPTGQEEVFRHSLPLSCLGQAGLSRETLMRLLWFGFQTVGSLNRLSQAQLEARFGEGRLLFELSRARDTRPVGLYTPPPRIQAAYQAEEELTEPADYEPVLFHLLDQASEELHGRQVRWLSVRAELGRDTVTGRRFLSLPEHRPKRLRTAARLALEEALKGFPRPPAIERLEVMLGGLLEPVPSQGRLWVERGELKRQGLQKALDRLRMRFPGRLRRVCLHHPEAYLPEDAWSLEPVP
ncbi:MAG: hypothetical protein AB1758_35790, partial [Candidatus Eremiobacterota bacterium]